MKRIYTIHYRHDVGRLQSGRKHWYLVCCAGSLKRARHVAKQIRDSKVPAITRIQRWVRA